MFGLTNILQITSRLLKNRRVVFELTNILLKQKSRVHEHTVNIQLKRLLLDKCSPLRASVSTSLAQCLKA